MLVTGRYNALAYEVLVDDEVVYRAGNAPGCSQTYLAAEAGVGVDMMRRFCVSTCEEIAEERGGTVGTVEEETDVDQGMW